MRLMRHALHPCPPLVNHRFHFRRCFVASHLRSALRWPVVDAVDGRARAGPHIEAMALVRELERFGGGRFAEMARLHDDESEAVSLPAASLCWTFAMSALARATRARRNSSMSFSSRMTWMPLRTASKWRRHSSSLSS